MSDLEIPERIAFAAIVYEGFSEADVAKTLEDMGFKVRIHDRLGMVSGTGPVALVESAFKTKFIFAKKTLENLNTGPFEIMDWDLETNPSVPESLVKSVEAVCIDKPMYLTD
jgi:subtilase family serine protease